MFTDQTFESLLFAAVQALIFAGTVLVAAQIFAA